MRAGAGAWRWRVSLSIASGGDGKELAISDADERLYLQLRAEAARYATSWWLEDAAVSARCREVPGLRAELELATAAGLVATTDVYESGDGEWAGERRPVQYGACPPDVGNRPRVSDLPRQAYLLAGPPGAGKTTTLTRIVQAHRAVMGCADDPLGVVAVDDIRAALPEYEGGLGSQVVHQEACFLAYEVVYPRLITSAADVLVDSIGRVGYVRDWADQLARAGCQVHLLAATCPAELAVERMRARALQTHRLVPSMVIREAVAAGNDVLAAAGREGWPLASMALVDTSGPADQPPILVQGSPTWGKTGKPVVLW
ncbi:MAG: zeta toxin family protein [Mycobacteriales bacterium]